MTIDEKMISAVDYLIGQYGLGYIATTGEIKSLLCKRYDVKESSAIPSDYCYNRVNNGISLTKPALFEYAGLGRYKCLGMNYPYDGFIYHRSHGTTEDFVIGLCKAGTRMIADDFEPGRPSRKDAGKGRDPSPRLRYRVLERDHFTCQACGASPAKDSSVSLHIDHIIPWSKGGRTTLENLQTLCARCNLGKGNLM